MAQTTTTPEVNSDLKKYLLSPNTPKIDYNATILDPCCRNNEIKIAFSNLQYFCLGTDFKNEIDYSNQSVDLKDQITFDATSYAYWKMRNPEYVVTQPPNNNISISIINWALTRAKKGVLIYIPVEWLFKQSASKHKLLSDNYHITTIINGSDNFCFIYFPKESMYPISHINYLL